MIKRAGLAVHIVTLPVARLHFYRRIHPEHIGQIHAAFTKPHARFKFIGNKTLGIALINLGRFLGRNSNYLETVKRDGHAGPQSKKAASRGYQFRRIDRNQHVDEIHAIHTSSLERQGRPMDAHYLVKEESFDDDSHYECYGTFDSEGRLAAYCCMGRYGNFAATDKLMGYKNQDGAMYLLLLKIICQLIDERRLEYFMYDTYLGAKPGLQDFKRRLGFRPYRAIYTLT
nr:hypothetical protein [Massilia sp. IC2-278]